MSTIAKALALLDLFTETRPQLGLSEVQRLTGRDKATAHRHLSALEGCGYLEQDPATRAYRLGPALTRLADMRIRTVPEVEMVRAVIDALSRDVEELVHISRLRGFDLEHVYHAEHHDHPLRVSFDPYGLPPLLATASGKAWLAFSAPDQLDLALEDPSTRPPEGEPFDAVALREELAGIARAGYATTRDVLRFGVSSVAIPVFDGQGGAAATCSIAYPSGRGGAAQEARLARLLMGRGQEITAAMGGQVPVEVLALWRQR